jgi:hypothetical protein
MGRSRRRGYALKEASHPNNAVDSAARAGIIRECVRIE